MLCSRIAASFKRKLKLYQLILKDNRTPSISKIFIGIAIGYALMPFDLIPDWIPIIGHLDDLIIIPLFIIIALKFVPHQVIKEHRAAL